MQRAPVYLAAPHAESGMSRVARQLAVPAVLGLVIGVVLAYQSGTSNAGVTQIPLGTYVTPAASNTAAALATAAPAAGMKPNTTCDMIVPANPLSAQGLATPYRQRSRRDDACAVGVRD